MSTLAKSPAQSKRIAKAVLKATRSWLPRSSCNTTSCRRNNCSSVIPVIGHKGYPLSNDTTSSHFRNFASTIFHGRSISTVAGSSFIFRSTTVIEQPSFLEPIALRKNATATQNDDDDDDDDDWNNGQKEKNEEERTTFSTFLGKEDGQRPKNQHSEHAKKRKLQIETDNFRSRFHNTLCRSAKYKVHAPNCSCTKVVKLRDRYRANTQSSGSGKLGGTDDNNNNNDNNNNVKDDEEMIIHDMENVQITDGKRLDNHNDPFDNLIVIPDTKSPSQVYSCQGTGTLQFQNDGLACEKKLRHELFPLHYNNSIQSNDNDQSTTLPFKVSCAQCLLTSLQPNGFVAIASTSLRDLNITIDHARASARFKEQHGTLHSDHAPFVCAVKLSSLLSLSTTRKNRRPHRYNALVMDILTQMKKGDVALPKKLFEEQSDGGEAMVGESDVSPSSSSFSSESMKAMVDLGHHLKSLLKIVRKEKKQRRLSRAKKSGHVNTGNNGREDSELQVYIMVLGYKCGRRRWLLDLPGGKRHLGETTLQGLIREVEEECSLKMEEDWLSERMPRLYGGNLSHDESVGGADDAFFWGTQSGNNEHEELVHMMETNESGYGNVDVFIAMTPPPHDALHAEKMVLKEQE